jgi:hypothetical protein
MFKCKKGVYTENLTHPSPAKYIITGRKLNLDIQKLGY